MERIIIFALFVNVGQIYTEFVPCKHESKTISVFGFTSLQVLPGAECNVDLTGYTYCTSEKNAGMKMEVVAKSVQCPTGTRCLCDEVERNCETYTEDELDICKPFVQPDTFGPGMFSYSVEESFQYGYNRPVRIKLHGEIRQDKTNGHYMKLMHGKFHLANRRNQGGYEHFHGSVNKRRCLMRQSYGIELVDYQGIDTNSFRLRSFVKDQSNNVLQIWSSSTSVKKDSRLEYIFKRWNVIQSSSSGIVLPNSYNEKTQIFKVSGNLFRLGKNNRSLETTYTKDILYNSEEIKSSNFENVFNIPSYC